MTLVDFSQIVSAIATAAAVWLSLALAGRHERPRLLAYVYFDKRQASPDGNRRISLGLSVSNAGISPIRITRVALYTSHYWTCDGWMADQRMNLDGASVVLPLLLERNQDAKVEMPVFFGFQPWFALPRGKYRFQIMGALHRWWAWRNVGFQIHSSIGTIFVRLPVEEVKWLQEEVLQPYDERHN